MKSGGPAFLILFATLMATAGSGISIVAFPWLALQHHNSARDASAVALAMTLPLVLSTLVAGAAVDFFGRRRVSLVSDSLSGTAVAAVPLIAWWLGADALNLAVLAVLAFFAAGFDPAGTTARESMLPEAAARAGWSLARTNSLYEAILNLGFIVGPGIGGLMIATVGGINTMWVTAALFGLSILTIGPLRLEGTGKPEREARPAGWMSGIAEGLRFVWNVRVLRTLGLIDLAVTALYLPMESVLFPKYFSDQHQPAQLGWALMAIGFGGVAGALGYAALSKHLRRRTAVLTATLTFGAATVGVAFLPPLPVILVLCADNRPGLRADPADLQLRHADPSPASAARSGGRGDDRVDLRGGPVGLAGGRSADRRGRAEGHVPGAGGADPADRPGRLPAAVVARTGPRAGVRARPRPRDAGLVSGREL